jgi:cystathionine gamma-lyase
VRPDQPNRQPRFETICAHWAEDPARYQGAVIPPIYQNSLFTAPNCAARYDSPAEDYYDYPRVANPTTEIAEAKIAALEGGQKARGFGSGMAAISAAILACVQTGDHVIAVETIYGPTRQFLTEYGARFGFDVTFIPGDDPQQFADALQPNTTLIYLESPSSLVFRQQDLAAVAALAQSRGIATICDNSWASPYFQNPLDFGIDLVVHSATKYLGGHSDIVAGVVVGNEERMTRLITREGYLLGATLDPFAAWLLLRGLRTLALRMERHQQTATLLTRRLLEHPSVAFVLYPGLPTDSQPELTRRQLRGTSGLFSFALKENTKAAAYHFVDRLRYFGIGCSWGGFESLALPMRISPHMLPGLTEPRWIVRAHLGLENAEDLWKDIENALEG